MRIIQISGVWLMDKYVINGGKQLFGEVNISGAKKCGSSDNTGSCFVRRAVYAEKFAEYQRCIGYFEYS